MYEASVEATKTITWREPENRSAGIWPAIFRAAA
jgi:hypothetical protein